LSYHQAATKETAKGLKQWCLWLNYCFSGIQEQITMKTRSLIIVLFFAFACSFRSADIIDDISSAIRSGNPKSITAFFIENVDLKVIAQEDVYSKQQAEMILRDFFSKHAVRSFAVAHKSEQRNGSQYVIGTLDTSNGKFRTYYLLKSVGGQTLIQQFRIETENE
jgi:hypothetical protein